MKVYVDELPKSCAKCELCSHIFTNCLPNLYKCAVDGHARFAEYKVEDEEPCPLESLADYTKQVRKEMCEKFVEQFMLEYTMGNEPVEDIIYKVADQMQGEDINA